MARSAKSRNSRNTRKPVTIDLDADAVVDESAAAAAEQDSEKTTPEEQSEIGAEETPTPAPSKSNTRLSNISGGLIGGALALIGGAILQWVGILPSPAPEPAAVEQVDLTPVQSEIESLRSEIATLQSSAGDTASEETRSAIDAVSSVAEATASQAQALETSLQQLDAKVADIETSISAGAAGEDAGLDALAGRIAELEAATESGNADSDAVAALQAELTRVESSMSALESDLKEQAASLSAQIASMEESIGGDASSANVAAAIASAGLKSAIDRGGSFMAELETYASVAGDSDIVAELRNHAASGVATINQLADQFPAVHNRIIAVGEGLTEDASVTDRLMASARSLVQVRTVGDVEGEGADQIAARIEARLKESDLSAALAEWESLPDAAKEASAGFADSLRARQAVDAMVARALSGAMAASAPASN